MPKTFPPQKSVRWRDNYPRWLVAAVPTPAGQLLFGRPNGSARQPPEKLHASYAGGRRCPGRAPAEPERPGCPERRVDQGAPQQRQVCPISLLATRTDVFVVSNPHFTGKTASLSEGSV